MADMRHVADGATVPLAGHIRAVVGRPWMSLECYFPRCTDPSPAPPRTLTTQNFIAQWATTPKDSSPNIQGAQTPGTLQVAGGIPRL